jgi:hypothetical protein
VLRMPSRSHFPFLWLCVTGQTSLYRYCSTGSLHSNVPTRHWYSSDGMHVNGQQSPWSKPNSAVFKARSHAPSPTAQSRARLAAACFTARDAAGTGLAVGSAVGALVEMAMHLDCSHSALPSLPPMQSSLSAHFRPSSHGRHDPPQSTSVSSPLSWPSMQDIEVGDRVVGLKDGRGVIGGGGGPVLPTTL